MIDLLVVEIFKGKDSPETRVVKGSNGKPDRTYYDQKAYFSPDGFQRIELTISHQNLTDCLLPGRYYLAASSFQVVAAYGRGQIELDKFKMKWLPVPPDLKLD